MRLQPVAFYCCFFATVQPVYSQDKYQVDLSDLRKRSNRRASKPYSLGGFLEFQPIFFGIDRDAAFSQLNFDLKRSGNTFDAV